MDSSTTSTSTAPRPRKSTKHTNWSNTVEHLLAKLKLVVENEEIEYSDIAKVFVVDEKHIPVRAGDYMVLLKRDAIRASQAPPCGVKWNFWEYESKGEYLVRRIEAECPTKKDSGKIKGRQIKLASDAAAAASWTAVCVTNPDFSFGVTLGDVPAPAPAASAAATAGVASINNYQALLGIAAENGLHGTEWSDELLRKLSEIQVGRDDQGQLAFQTPHAWSRAFPELAPPSPPSHQQLNCFCVLAVQVLQAKVKHLEELVDRLITEKEASMQL